MQVQEVLRSATQLSESVSADDPRCLAAVQEIYAVISSLRAPEIRRLTLEGEYLHADGSVNTHHLTTVQLQSQQQQPSSAPQSQQESRSASTSTTAMQQQQQAGGGAAASGTPTLPPHLADFAGGPSVVTTPALSVRSLILLTTRCYNMTTTATAVPSQQQQHQHSSRTPSATASTASLAASTTAEQVAQVALVVLRLCVTADAILAPLEVQSLAELALQLGVGKMTKQNVRQQNSQQHHQQQHHHQHPQPSSVSVLAAIELLLVTLYNSSVGVVAADASLGGACRQPLAAWLARIEDSAAPPIEIFHRLCCLQRLVQLRPVPASNALAGHSCHERLIGFVCGEGGAVHASSVGLALHLLAQLVEHGPEPMMLGFVTSELIEQHIAAWAASEWTETLEGAFVLLTACARLPLAPELWTSMVRANLHLAAASAIGSPSVRVAAAAASCLRTMLFLCKRDLDIGLSVFFDAQVAPNILKVLDNSNGNNVDHNNHLNNSAIGHLAAAAAAHNQHHNNNSNNNSSGDAMGHRILSAECALAVAVFSSFTPQHRAAMHHVASKFQFPLAVQRAQLVLNDCDLSMFVNWVLFDEAGRPNVGADDAQFTALLSARPLSQPPPGTSPAEWAEAAYVKSSLLRALHNPTELDLATLFPTLVSSPKNAAAAASGNVEHYTDAPHPRPELGSKEMSLALLRWFSGPLQRIAVTEGKAGFENQHHNNNNQNASSYQTQHYYHDDSNGGVEHIVASSASALHAQTQFESCVNLILRFSKSAPLPKPQHQHLLVNNQTSHHYYNEGDPTSGLNSSHVSGGAGGRVAAIQRNLILVQQQQQQQQQQNNVSTPPPHNQVNNASASSSARRGASAVTASGGGGARRGNTRSVSSTVSSSSCPTNEHGFRRTHLFSHPYVDYYMNAQKKNQFTPNPTIPPNVRRWSLKDIQRSDIFSFCIRLDGLDRLVAEHEGKAARMMLAAARLHNEYDEDDEEGEEYEEEVDDDEEDGEDGTQHGAENSSEFVIDEEQHQKSSSVSPADAGAAAAASSSTSRRRKIITVRRHLHRNNTKNSNNAAPFAPQDAPLAHLSEMMADEDQLAGGGAAASGGVGGGGGGQNLQQRVLSAVAEALHAAEMHLLALNEKCQTCPTKLVSRRALLLDMINNVMPAVVSMLTMMFSVAKRAPAAIVRVAQRVEHQQQQEHHNEHQQHQQQLMLHAGNLCAVCHGLELEAVLI